MDCNSVHIIVYHLPFSVESVDLLRYKIDYEDFYCKFSRMFISKGNTGFIKGRYYFVYINFNFNNLINKNRNDSIRP